MVKDHLGNEYESIVEMCKAYSINPSTYKFLHFIWNDSKKCSVNAAEKEYMY